MLRVEIVEKISTGLGIVVLDTNSKKNLRKEKKNEVTFWLNFTAWFFML